MLIDFEKMKIRGTSVRSVKLRELNGHDSEAAAARVASTGATHGFVIQMAHRDELVSEAIVQVNGADVVTPYVDWKGWNLRTREFVLEVHNKMNSTSAKELESFFVALGLAEVAEPVATQK